MQKLINYEKRRKLKRNILVTFLIVGMLLSACQTQQPAPAAPQQPSEPAAPAAPAAPEDPAAPGVDVVRIGVIQPISGPDGKYGEVIIPAYEYAVKQVNDQGGIKSLGGARLEIVWSDHQSSAETAISEVERLVERGRVSVIAGANLSGIVLAATTATERLQVPFVVDVPAATAITERGFEYVFRTNVSGLFYGDTFVEFVDYLNQNGADINSVAVTFRILNSLNRLVSLLRIVREMKDRRRLLRRLPSRRTRFNNLYSSSTLSQSRCDHLSR
jgi:hypothetical protein